MKSGSITTASSENCRARIALGRRKRWWSQYWRSRRLCGVFAIDRISSTIRFSPTAKLLIRTFTTNNISIWRHKEPALNKDNRREIVFHQNSARPSILSWQTWLENSYSSILFIRSWHQVITSFTCLRRMIFLLNTSPQEKFMNIDSRRFLTIETSVSIRVEFWNCACLT